MSVTVTVTMPVTVSMAITTLVFDMTAFMRMTMVMIMVVSWSLMQNVDENEVEHQAEHCGNKHNLALNIVVNENSVNGLNKEPNGDDEEADDGDGGSNDLGSMPSICVLMRDAFPGQGQRNNTQNESE
jgi:hypothetical protein